jgi:hypothetical protein
MKICAVDTCILMRLAAGDPAELFAKTVETLQNLIDRHFGLRIVAHNMVIGEAYIALQKHYGLTKPESRQSLADVLTSGLVEPLDGQAALDTIEAAAKGAGLMDRLILLDSQARFTVPLFTLDQALIKVPGAEELLNH